MEFVIPCSDGIEIAAKQWRSPELSNDGGSGGSGSGSGSSHDRILLLHGWLDNAASFHLLAPRLSQELGPCDILAIDFPGHGLSSHKSCDGPTQLISEYAFYVAESLSAMGWDSDGNSSEGEESNHKKITIIGHSMGAAVSLIYAAAFPEHIERIVLLEGAGPIARNALEVSNHIRQSITRRRTSNRILYPHMDKSRNGNEKPVPRKRVYKSLDFATATRQKTAQLSPGNQYISYEAASAVVRRATIPADDLATHDASKGGGDEIPIGYQGPISFRHDQRLNLPSIQYFTEEQVQQLYRDTQAPVYMFSGEDGWPATDADRDSIVNLLQPVVRETFPGSHHLHADPDTADAVITSVIENLKR